MSNNKIVPEMSAIEQSAPKTKVKDTVAQPEVKTKVPGVKIIGCGGTGVRVSSILASVFSNNPNVSVTAIDTSSADTEYVSGLNVINIGGMGSGMFRRENANEIAAIVPTRIMPELDIDDEICILIFSASGGSGSVIAPHLIKTFAQYGVNTIAIVIADTSTSGYTTNTISTMKSIESIVKSSEVYLPTMIFSNDHGGIRRVNADILQQMNILIKVLTIPAISIDQNDRKHWLNPRKTLGLPPGVYTLEVVSDGAETTPTSQMIDTNIAHFDSVLNFIPHGKEIEDYPHMRVEAISGKLGYIPNGANSFAGRIYVPGEYYRKWIAGLSERNKIEKALTQRFAETLVPDAKDVIDPSGMVFD